MSILRTRNGSLPLLEVSAPTTTSTTTSLPPRPRNAPQQPPGLLERTRKGEGCTPHTRPPSLRGRPAATLTRTRRSRDRQEGRRAAPPRAVAGGGSRGAARQKAQARLSGLPAPSGLAPGRQTAPRELTSAEKRKHRGK
uniref:Uncharacterized protein n=1 Tax=Rangifer tarandus platyrhynchus TaxID=3082113 RepID=A0ACB0FA23_RANTA|nr:unnamed protein product [Rangifer tarandus platyrhynchus]